MKKPQTLWTLADARSPIWRAMRRWAAGVPEGCATPRDHYSPHRWECKVRAWRRIWRRFGGDPTPHRRLAEDWLTQRVAGAGIDSLISLSRRYPIALPLPRRFAEAVRHAGKRRRHGRGYTWRPAMLTLCRSALAVARTYPPEAYYGRRTGPHPWDVEIDLARLVVAEDVCLELRWDAEGLTADERLERRREMAEAERARADEEAARREAEEQSRASAERVWAGLRADGYTDEQITAAARAAAEAV